MHHTLKIKKEYADEIAWKNKTFELRKNDRGFKQGDTVSFTVIDTDGNGNIVITYTDHEIAKKTFDITYVLENVPEYGLQDGYCIFGIKDRADWKRIDKEIKDISQAVAKIRETIAYNIG